MAITTEHYQAVRDAAEALSTSISRDTWALADSVLAAVPHQGNGGRPTTDPESRAVSVDDLMAELAERLAEDGVTNTRGEPWSPRALDQLRDTVMAWPPGERLTCCAFNTHREALGDERQAALRALAAYAEGEHVDLPEDIRDRIDGRKVRGARYSVTVDDMRVLLGNRPGRQLATDPATPAQVAQALQDPEKLAEAMEQLDDEQANQVFTNAVHASASSHRPSQKPEVQTARRENREQREQPPSRYEIDVAQARLILETVKAFRRVLASFADHRPEPEGLAMTAWEDFITLVDESREVALDPDAMEEGLQRMLHEER